MAREDEEKQHENILFANNGAIIAEYILIDAVAAKRLRKLADDAGCSMRAWVEQAIREASEKTASDSQS